MAAKGLIDDKGVILKANKILPNELSKDFIEALAELEDNEAHRTRTQFRKAYEGKEVPLWEESKEDKGVLDNRSDVPIKPTVYRRHKNLDI